jgi:hypothetical protein
LPGLERLVMSHGEPIERPRDTLIELARSLDGLAPSSARSLQAQRRTQPRLNPFIISLQEHAKRRAS